VAGLGAVDGRRGWARRSATDIGLAESSSQPSSGAGGFLAVSSILSRHEADLALLQAESGNSWNSPMRAKAGGGGGGGQQPAYASYYQSPIQPHQQQFSVVVDGRQPDAGIAAPPLAYSAANPSRYAPYSSGPAPPPPQQQQQQGGPYDISFDTFDRHDGLGTLYQPLQPGIRQGPTTTTTAGTGHHQPPQLQPSLYSPHVPSQTKGW
jgi:hypothetical protein